MKEIKESSHVNEYTYSITDVTSNESKVFCISGKLNVYSGEDIASCEFILRRRDTGFSYAYAGRLERKNNELLFDVEIDVRKLQESLCLNSIWDTYIQIMNAQKKQVFQTLVLIKDKNIKNHGDRYLQNLEIYPGKICTLHVTENKNNLAFWYVDKERFELGYTFAIGKIQYYKTIEEEPLNEKMVFFESFLGKQYNGNPKYIYEEMLRDPRFADFKFVWSISKEKWHEIPSGTITVERGSPDYFKYLAMSKYWVNNVVFPIQNKREGNVYLQTWHGTPLKKLLFDIEVDGPETLARENFYSKSLSWDYLIAQNDFSRETLSRAFRFEKEIIVEGYPVNDIFYQHNIKNKEEEIKKKVGIPKGKKVILYAPTWRDNEIVGSWNHSFSLNFDIEKMKAQLSNEYVLVLRMHHLISSKLVIDEAFEDFVIDCSNYSDIQELYVISDILVTDYSSTFFDFANKRKPILFYAYDFEVYKDELRGLYLDMEKDLPGPMIRNEAELLHALINIDSISKTYSEKYAAFCERFCNLDDGGAAKRIIDKVFVGNSEEIK